MGKGSRNREFHRQERVDNPQKYQAPKTAPKWIKPAVSVLLLVAILVGACAWIVSGLGIVQRNRVIVESKTGKYDVTQQMATYFAWQSMYQTGAWYWSLTQQIGSSSGTNSQQYTQDQYALLYAASVQDALRDGIDGVITQILRYVALCDAADAAGMELSEADLESVQATLDALWAIKKSVGYSATSKGKYLSEIMAPGMKEKDIRAALEMMVLANKFALDYQNKKEQGLINDPELDKILAGYRDENPADFYSGKYLVYDAETQELAEKLAAATTADEFKEIIIQNGFDKNYKIVFNRYTTAVVAQVDLKKFEGKTNAADGENATAWTDGINSVTGWEAVTEYAKEGSTLPESIQTWLFADTREAFDSYLITLEDAVYLVALDEVVELGKNVKAHIKTYAMDDGESYDEKDNFKTLVYDYIKHLLMETEKPEISYQSALEKAEALEKALKVENAEVEAILHEAGAVLVKMDEKPTIPSAVTKALEGAKENDVILAKVDFDTHYLLFVDKVENKKYEYRYVAFESDVFNQIGDDIAGEIRTVFPEEKSLSYVKDEKDATDAEEAEITFTEWICEVAEGETLVFVRKANDAKWFTEKDPVLDKDGKEVKDSDGNVKTQDVMRAYFVTSEMKYDTENVKYHGGFVQFKDTGAAEKAEEQKNKLAGKTYAELVSALYTASGTTSYEKGIEVSKLTDENVKAWFEAEGRVANEVAIVDSKDGKSKYVVAFTGKMSAWESDAMIGYITEECENWAADLSKDYKANEKVLDKIGEPTTTTAAA